MTDNELWVHAMYVGRDLLKATGQTEGTLETRLWHLLHTGVFDKQESKKPWASSTRSMRYTAATADTLRRMLAKESARVGPLFHSDLLND